MADYKIKPQQMILGLSPADFCGQSRGLQSAFQVEEGGALDSGEDSLEALGQLNSNECSMFDGEREREGEGRGGRIGREGPIEPEQAMD